MDFFTKEEIEKARTRSDLTGIKNKSVKLNMDDEEDKMLYIYLEDKNFTDIIKQSLKIYKKHFDPVTLQKKALEQFEALSSQKFTIPANHNNNEAPQKNNTFMTPDKNSVKSNMSEF